MLKNEDIQIYFEEGELINNYLESRKKGIVQEKPVFFVVDSDEDKEEVYSKSYVFCDCCGKEVMNFCPGCGNLDIDTRKHGFACSHCLGMFTSQTILAQHKRKCDVGMEHPKTRFTKCPFCKRYKKQSTLYNHLKICGKKNGAKEPTTPICITYNNKNIVQAIYSCHLCNKNFSVAQIYKRHMATHTAPSKCATEQQKLPVPIVYNKKDVENTVKATYSCHVCNMKFSDVNNYRRHMDSHNTCSNPKNNNCTICWHAESMTSTEFTRHMWLMHNKRTTIMNRKFAHSKFSNPISAIPLNFKTIRPKPT